jgi:hypothetical protein
LLEKKYNAFVPEFHGESSIALNVGCFSGSCCIVRQTAQQSTSETFLLIDDTGFL